MGLLVSKTQGGIEMITKEQIMDWAETYDEAIESLLNMANDHSYTGKDLAEAIEDYRAGMNCLGVGHA